MKHGANSNLAVPSSGSLWLGTQQSMDDYTRVALQMESMPMVQRLDMSTRAIEMRSTMTSADDNYENHYMIDTVNDGKIAIVSIAGALLDHSMPLRMFGLGVTTYGEIQDAMQAVLRDSRVERIVMRVGSGGGTSIGLFRTGNFLKKVGQQKRLDTFTDSQMGSAAYWLGAIGEEIVAEPLAEVGSIGVYVAMTSRAKANSEAGIDVKIVRAGEFKALGHVDEPISEKAEAEVQRAVDKLYGAFLEHSSEQRGVNMETFRTNAAEGRVFTGQDAVKAGLVDRIAVFDDYIESMMSTKSKTVPAGGGRNPKMDEGTMNKAQLALLAKLGIQLTSEQHAQLASGTSFDAIGLSAEVVTQLAAVKDVADEPAKTQEELDAEAATKLAADEEAKRLAANPAANQGSGDLMQLVSQITALSGEVATLKASLATATVERDAAKKASDETVTQLSLLKPICALAINRMEVGMRMAKTEGLEQLDPVQLNQRFEATQAKWLELFPVGQKSKQVVDKETKGADRLPSLAVAAAEATKI